MYVLIKHIININFSKELNILPQCFQIVSKYYIFYVNFLLNVYVNFSYVHKVNIKIWASHLEHVKCVKFDINFPTV